MKTLRAILFSLLVLDAQAQMPPGGPLIITNKTLVPVKSTATLSPRAASSVSGLVTQTNIITHSNIIAIVWMSDYQGVANVATEIDATTGLIRPGWQKKFVTQQTNGVILPTNSAEFFRGKSVFITVTN